MPPITTILTPDELAQLNESLEKRALAERLAQLKVDAETICYYCALPGQWLPPVVGEGEDDFYYHSNHKGKGKIHCDASLLWQRWAEDHPEKVDSRDTISAGQGGVHDHPAHGAGPKD